jgi:ATP-dependent RNA helicase SUPV3L1/SUV3
MFDPENNPLNNQAQSNISAKFGASGEPRITAVLGPTNTGKTYLAIDRMMGHVSGMMGFPLRLLARENYERVVAIKGADKVALVTGEEKIIPPNASYFLCTVESMPLDRKVAFLAIDEVQLAGDPERGHIFTDRILHARGYGETMFLGSDTMAPMIRQLVPGCEFISRPRFSRLSFVGSDKITRLPPRSAVVAFSAAEVYGIAELLRRTRGGAAVVMGALSPRTRNAQVAMFQSGEVDYLVATDAIGMGLNMDVTHVAFGQLHKFDGRKRRMLTGAEFGQIAGRAGRHMNDGTFGTTSETGQFTAEMVEAIEGHTFEKIRAVYWRNSDLNFGSPQALLRALSRPPPAPGLLGMRLGPDHLALKTLAAEPEIRATATNADRVRLLWEVCQIPDFRGRSGGQHVNFLSSVYRAIGAGGVLSDDWVARNVDRMDRTDGDIETLTGRIDQIRTWTYISQRTDWMRDAVDWQDRTRAIENNLSDALHDRLTQRFVDRRTTALVKGMKSEAELLTSIEEDGRVKVEGHFVGRLDGLRFREDMTYGLSDGDLARKAVRGAAQAALKPVIAARLLKILDAPSGDFRLADDGFILWQGRGIATLAPGRDILSPVVSPLSSELLSAKDMAALGGKLTAWLSAHLERNLGPLMRARAGASNDTISGPARGIFFQLSEGLGAVARGDVEALVRSLDPKGRKALAAAGVRLGTKMVFIDAMDKGHGVRLRGLLWANHHKMTNGDARSEISKRIRTLIRSGPTIPTIALIPKAHAGQDPVWEEGFCLACGYVLLGPRLLSCSRTEILASTARKLARQGAFSPTLELGRLAGGDGDDLVDVLLALGFQSEESPDGLEFVSPQRAKRTKPSGRAKPDNRSPVSAKRRSKTRAQRHKAHKGSAPAVDEHSPFAKLREIKFPQKGPK